MNRFADLPTKVRALLLAKLVIELTTNRCASLYELAKRQNTDMMTKWRDVCRLSKQPICAIPDMTAQPH